MKTLIESYNNKTGEIKMLTLTDFPNLDYTILQIIQFKPVQTKVVAWNYYATVEQVFESLEAASTRIAFLKSQGFAVEVSNVA